MSRFPRHTVRSTTLITRVLLTLIFGNGCAGSIGVSDTPTACDPIKQRIDAEILHCTGKGGTTVQPLTCKLPTIAASSGSSDQCTIECKDGDKTATLTEVKESPLGIEGKLKEQQGQTVFCIPQPR